MTDLRQQTIDVYNQTAEDFAKKFRGLGAQVRTQDIELAFEMAGNPKNARVVEIGCGDGRDAREIIKRTDSYLGFDIAKEFVRIASQYVPHATFKVGDAVNFEYPDNTDIVFAFASLLHLNKDEVKIVLQRVHTALKRGGIFYISLKWTPDYRSEVKKDQFGERLYYFYTPELIASLAGSGYEVARTWRHTRQAINHGEWFEIVLKKI